MTSDETPKESPEQKIARLSQALGIDKLVQRQEEQAKMLDGVIHELGNTNQNISNLKTWLQSLVQPQQGEQQPQVQVLPSQEPQIPQGMAGMLMGDPQAKIQMIQSIAEIVKMLRGGNPEPQANGGINMQNMLMEWFARVMQASLDGMASQVYGIQMQPPKGILNSAQRVRIGNVPESHGVE